MSQDNNYCDWMFYRLICWLEKYIEKADYYSDWERREQFQKSQIIRKDIDNFSEDRMLSFFSSTCFGKIVHFEVANSSLKLYKEQFYKWIDATGIKADNCPNRLKLILYALNEVLEGRTEKLEHDIENKKLYLDPGSPEYQKWIEKGFSMAIQNLGFKPEVEEFRGNAEKGEKNFSEILAAVSPTDYEKFYWCPQKEEIPADNSSPAQEATAELQKILDQANQLEKEGSSAEIKKIISELEQFKSNTTAHNGKNKYAWQKLNRGEKIAELKIALKIREFRGEDCSDCQEVSELQVKLIAKKIELENAEQENKSPAEIEKIKQEITDLEAEISRLTSPQKTTQNPKNSNAKYWISGIILVVLLSLTLIIAKKKRKKKHDSKK